MKLKAKKVDTKPARKKESNENKVDLVVSVAFCAAIVGRSEQSVNQWVRDRGCPKQGHGLMNAKEFVEWWAENVHSKDSPIVEDVKHEYWKAKAERERLRADLERGKLMDSDSVADQWVARVHEVSTGLEALARRLSILIPGNDHLFEREIRNMKEAYSRTGRYCGEE